MTSIVTEDAATAPAVDLADDSDWRRAESLPLAQRIGAFAFLLTGYFCYAWTWNTVDVLRPYIAEDLHLS
ncbi:hypothetical protein ABTL03_19805, partial [Acinetobacter baumannii]